MSTSKLLLRRLLETLIRWVMDSSKRWRWRVKKWLRLTLLVWGCSTSKCVRVVSARRQSVWKNIVSVTKVVCTVLFSADVRVVITNSPILLRLCLVNFFSWWSTCDFTFLPFHYISKMFLVWMMTHNYNFSRWDLRRVKKVRGLLVRRGAWRGRW